MLNSNFFSKRYFNLNIEALNLWLQSCYGIAFNKCSTLEQQKQYYNSYIRFLNYRQKYIREMEFKPSDKNCTYLFILEQNVLSDYGIQSYTNYNKRRH